jgi:hypothetical protein
MSSALQLDPAVQFIDSHCTLLQVNISYHALKNSTDCLEKMK